MKKHIYDILKILLIGVFVFVVGLSYMLLENKIPNFNIHLLSLIILVSIYFIYRMYKNKTLLENVYKVLVFGLAIFIIVVFGLFFQNSLNDKSLSRTIVKEKVQQKIDLDKTTKLPFKNENEIKKYKNANLEEKIKILKSLRLTKEEVSYRLKNDMKFKELTKNGIEDFNTIYNSK